MRRTQSRGRRAGLVATFAAAWMAAGPALGAEGYPTAARVDYVLACMASNGQDYLTMERCSCSIDSIMETVPFDSFVRVETIVRMREARGELALMFRTAPGLDEEVQAFREAQVQADLQCF